MHFAAKNLLYTFNQSLGTQFVTIAAFKRYARSPENRTFKNYFRKAKPFLTQHDTALNSWMVKNCLRKRGFQKCLNAPNPFTTYMSGRPHYALARYISMHRRKKNPILTNFKTQTINTIMEKLQHLVIPLKTEDWGLKTKIIQNKPISKPNKMTISHFINKTNAYCQVPDARKNKPISNPFTTARERKLPDGITQWPADAHFDGVTIEVP